MQLHVRARALRAKWNRAVNKWYDPTPDARLTERWGEKRVTDAMSRGAVSHHEPPVLRTYLCVPFKGKEQAKRLSARWDPQKVNTESARAPPQTPPPSPNTVALSNMNPRLTYSRRGGRGGRGGARALARDGGRDRGHGA